MDWESFFAVFKNILKQSLYISLLHWIKYRDFSISRDHHTQILDNLPFALPHLIGYNIVSKISICSLQNQIEFIFSEQQVENASKSDLQAVRKNLFQDFFAKDERNLQFDEKDEIFQQQ
ncbi:hypothetical protein ABPG72_017211 [Tetrahymena utriculariae]